MAKTIKKGFERCEICTTEYHISDPKTYIFTNKKVICKYCFIEVLNAMRNWSADRKKVIIFDFSKQSIPHKLKWKIWERDDFKCKKCGIRQNLSIDHIHPESFGGTLDEENLQTLCKSCNSIKYNNIYEK